ncbi:MAG: universal stress protein [Sideroxydans sp.]|nr:universal stress protein [Sideroxydans sp.]
MSDYPFERILLATEHTEFDVGAERIAFAMAKRCGVPLRAVLPVESNPEYVVQAPERLQREDQEAAAKVESLRAKAAAAGVEIEIKVRHGAETYREIVEEATSTNTDLIVIRRRGKPGFLSNKLVGEMVSKVIRDAHCSVLTVPRNAEFWQKGVLASVGDTPLAREISQLSAGIAQVCGLPLTIISIADSAAAMSRIESLNAAYVSAANTLSDNVQGWVREGAPAEQTVSVARETAADLIVIGRQRYHLIPFIHGNTSVMQKIIGAIEVPTLVVPA